MILHGSKHEEEFLCFLRREYRRRFVQDQDLRASVEDLDDLYRLLFGDGHFIDFLVQIDLETVSVYSLSDVLQDRLLVQLLLAGHAEDDVLGGAEYIDQLEVLVDHTDLIIKSILRGTDHGFFAVYENLSAVRSIDACEHVHQSGLAASVLAQKGKDLSRIDVHADVVIGCDRAECLRDIPQGNSDFLFRSAQGPPPFYCSHAGLSRKK